MGDITRKSGTPSIKNWWVYVIQSEMPRFDKQGKPLPGFFYVGSTVDPNRRLDDHNGLNKGKGGKYTSRLRPWRLMAVWGPYAGRSEAFKAEMTLKRTRRGPARLTWTPQDSDRCRGLGVLDLRVSSMDVVVR